MRRWGCQWTSRYRPEHGQFCVIMDLSRRPALAFTMRSFCPPSLIVHFGKVVEFLEKMRLHLTPLSFPWLLGVVFASLSKHWGLLAMLCRVAQVVPVLISSCSGSLMWTANPPFQQPKWSWNKQKIENNQTRPTCTAHTHAPFRPTPSLGPGTVLRSKTTSKRSKANLR